jgi:hypothetical protein
VEIGPTGGTLPLNSNLVLSQSVVIVAEDGIASLSMIGGTRPTASDGGPLLTLSIRRIADSEMPPVPDGAPFVFAGYAYDLEPSGSEFDPYATFSILLPENDWAAMQGRDLSIKWYNPATSTWEDLPTTVSSETRTVSAKITHTSIFALFVARGQAPATPVTTIATVTPTATPLMGDLPIDLIMKIAIVVIIVIAVIAIALYFLRRRKATPAEAEKAPEEEDWEIQGLT